jgi:hypothetical protein
MNRVLIALLATLALLTAASAAAGQARYRSCQQVNFTPNSDDVAAQIRVRNVSCTYARRFIRRTDGAPPETGERGWRCVGRPSDETEGLQHTKWRCTRRAQVMRWSRY